MKKVLIALSLVLASVAAVAQNVNLSNTTPAAPSGASNVSWQKDGSGNISAYASNTAAFFDKGGAVYNAKAYGAKGDERVTNPAIGSPAQAGCTVTAGSAIVTCTDLNFTSADVGKLFHLILAGPSSAEWVTTVSSVTDSSHAVMSGTASTTVSTGAWASVGTDDTTALNTTLTQAGLTCGIVMLPAGVYSYTPPLTVPTCVSIKGAGPNAINANRAPSGPEPDFNLWANTSPTGTVKSGTWLDAGDGVGLQLTNTMQVNLFDFGILNASYGIQCGSPTTLGCNWSTWRNLLVNGLQTNTGIASSQFSHAGYLIYATQHIYTDHIASYWVNTGLRLVTWNGEGAAAFYSTANNTFKDTYTFSYAHTSANGNTGEPCLWIENDDVTGEGGNEFVGQTQCNSYGNDSTATIMLIKGLTNPLVQQNFQQLDLEGGTGGCAITATRLTQSTLAHIGATNGNTTVCLDATDSQNTFDGPNGITWSGDTGTNRFNGLLQTAGAYGIYFDANDTNHFNSKVHQATSDTATVIGAGGNTGKVVMGGTTAIIVDNDNGTGGPMIQVGGGAGASANKTIWDNYGEQTTTGNCGTMMSMDTNRGLKLANGSCMYFVGLGSAVASATTITPSAMTFHVTGTTAIATIGVPTACNTSGTSCTLRLIPDGAFTTTTTGNIAIASTAVVGKTMEMTYDATAAKWYPSY